MSSIAATSAEHLARMGEIVASANAGDVLTCVGLGSCIGLALVDRRARVAGLAHVMLPESTPSATQVGKFADLAVLSADYFGVADDAIRDIESLLTVVGGRVVYAAGPYAHLDPGAPEVSPAWSPVARFGGYRAAD